MGESNINGPNDDALIRKAQAGDIDAFGELYVRYVAMIYRYVRTRVNDMQIAEDITEQVFLNVFRALAGYRPEGKKFSAYVYRAARNAVIDHYRKPSTDYLVGDQPQALVNVRALDDGLIESEHLAQIMRSFGELPVEYQEVIRLRILLDIPTVTVAEWLDKSQGAIRVLLHRALKALRKRVEEEDVN